MSKMTSFLLISIFALGQVFAQDDFFSLTYLMGNVRVITLCEKKDQGNSSILLGATADILQETIPEGTFPNALHAFFIQTPEKNILVDAGMGIRLEKNVKNLGLNPDQIDVILITHMHRDHYGGMLNNGRVVFENAEVYLSEKEYAYWNDDEEMNALPQNKQDAFLHVRELFSAYKDRIHTFIPNTIGEGSQELFPGIIPIAAYGHSPGHSMYLLNFDYTELLIWGDIAHAMAVQMPFMHVAVIYDQNPEQAVESRLKTLKFVTKNGIPVAGMHIPFPGIGTIMKNGDKGYQYRSILE